MGARAIQVEQLSGGIWDYSGNPLSGGKVYSYIAGTTTPKTLYTAADKSGSASNPLTLDAYGRALVYADGLYKFVIKDSSDTTILYTLDNLTYALEDSSTQWGGTSSGAANVFSLTVSPAITAFADGQVFRFKAHQSNTGASTLSVSGVSAIPIRFGSGGTQALLANQIRINSICTVVVYNSVAYLQPSHALTHTIVNAKEFGATGDGSTDDTTAIQAAINSASQVFFPAGKYRITSTLTCPHSVLLKGCQSPGTSGTNPYNSILMHDFNGTFISFTGSEASAYGSGGGLEDLMLYNTNGTTADSVGIAIHGLFTSTAFRPTWLRIKNVNIERDNTKGEWTWGVDWDASSAPDLDSLRDYFMENCRMVINTNSTGGGIRLRKVVGFVVTNCYVNGDKGDIVITGAGAIKSTQNFIIGGSQNSIQLDYADNTIITGNTCASITDTVNTTDTLIRAARTTNHIKLVGTGHVQYYKSTDTSYVHQSISEPFYVSRDTNAGDSTLAAQFAIGNHGSAQGRMLFEYVNAAAAASPVFRGRFFPRNNAGAAIYSGNDAGFVFTKTAGADTIKTELKSSGVTLSLEANGTVSTSGTKIEFGGTGTNRFILAGAGDPEGTITAVVGALYLRTDGGASTTLYVKESGTGNTGWIAK